MVLGALDVLRLFRGMFSPRKFFYVNVLFAILICKKKKFYEFLFGILTRYINKGGPFERKENSVTIKEI